MHTVESGNSQNRGPGNLRSLPALFEKQVRSCPNAPAVYLPDGDCWSYARLNSFANRVAQVLLARGLKPEQPVGVCMQRSPETVGILLGILKARGAYVPLDVNLPSERLEYIVTDAGLHQIFVDVHGSAKCHDAALEDVEILSSSIGNGIPDQPPQLAGNEHDLLAVLYTSGSTGKPKGVMLEHAAALRLVVGTKWLPISSDDVFLQASSLSFDAATFELWGPLLNGASLVTAPPSLAIAEIEYLLDAFGVTILWLTSGLFNVLMEERPASISKLRRLLTGGDIVSPRHARIALRHLKQGQLMNCYGPTENATFSTSHLITRSDTRRSSLPIGLPVDKATVYLLNESLRPIDDFQVGEIFVGGEGLSRGYWNRPELNDEKFMSVKLGAEISRRLYRTGDLGRYNSAGALEFVGRTDFQVKIRGFRVEPEEVELALCKMPGIASAAVIARGADAESKVLCCSYVATGPQLVSAEAIKRFLKHRLPDYMVPTFYLELKTLPRNTNDKVDRRALEAMFSATDEREGAAQYEAVPGNDETEAPSSAADRQNATQSNKTHAGAIFRKFGRVLGFHPEKRELSTSKCRS